MWDYNTELLPMNRPLKTETKQRYNETNKYEPNVFSRYLLNLSHKTKEYTFFSVFPRTFSKIEKKKAQINPEEKQEN